ncbi:MAG: hypothetical protein O2825_01950 [Proteobacteria bacterium]|nr:hypothetical protein [Pseudomonadota bacterium]
MPLSDWVTVSPTVVDRLLEVPMSVSLAGIGPVAGKVPKAPCSKV